MPRYRASGSTEQAGMSIARVGELEPDLSVVM